MNLTILYRSRRLRFIYSLSRWQVVLLVGALLGAAFYAGRVSYNPSDAHARVVYTQTGLQQQRQEVELLKQATEQRLTGMLLKLGEMQGQLQRLNALGEKLALEYNLNVDEFNFRMAPAVGGPAQEVVDIDIESSAEVLASMDIMLGELDDKSQQLQALESILLNHHISDQSYIAGRPIASGWLSSYYGIRKDPFSGLPAMHKGLDFAGDEGSGVIATGAGIVTWAGDRYGYGQMIEIDHGDGITTRYGHNKHLDVKVGDVVTKGQQIAQMGKTGRATGAHVHYEVLRHGKQLDPLPFISRGKKGS